jgi:excisionase family DNA binding protein
MNRRAPLSDRVELTRAAMDRARRSNDPHAAVLPRLLTVQELSEMLRLSPRTVRRLVAARRIPCVRLGRSPKFLPGDVFRWLEARKEG